MTGPNSAPEVSASWDRIEAWLGAHAPRTLGTLLPPADPAAVRATAGRLGVTLPGDLVASLARHEGTDPGSPDRFSLGGDGLSPLETVERRNRSKLEALQNVDGEMFDGRYWHRRFVQITDCATADGLVVDCRPGPAHGAVGHFFNGEGTTFGLWPSFAGMLAALADALESGGPFHRRIPVAFGGRLAWELRRGALPEPEPVEPRSLFELAAAAGPRRTAPSGARFRAARDFVPVPEAGWVGEYRGFCLTFVRGIDPAELLRRYGAVPETVLPRTRDEARESAAAWTEGYLPTVRAGVAGAWVFGFEETIPRQGDRDEVLRRLSAGTRAVRVYHATQLRLAVFDDGAKTTEYTTSDPEHRSGTNPDLLARALHGAGLLPLDLARYPDEDVYAALDVLATEFGIGFDSAALGGPLLSGRILPVLADPRPRAAGIPARGEPRIAELVACADDGRLRAALLAQTRRLAVETGLDRYPEVTEALGRAETGETWTVADDSPLGMRLRQVDAEAEAARASRTDPLARDLLTEPERTAWTWRSSAGDALRAVVGLRPREAVFSVLNQRRDPDWRAQFADDLGEVDVPEGTAARLQESEQQEYAQKVARARRLPVSLNHLQRPQRRPAAQQPPRVVRMTPRHGSGARTRPPE
jgi:cell wall assembly regulator SMI1